MEHLIADTGLQFITTEVTFNPSEPLQSAHGRILKYTFCETENFVTGETQFDAACFHTEDGVFVPYTELINAGALRTDASGNGIAYDEFGLPIINDGVETMMFTTYEPDSSQIYSFNALESLRIENRQRSYERRSAFEMVLGHWLPMPMYQIQEDGSVMPLPKGWCRMKMEEIGATGRKGVNRYRCTWAFDTATTTDIYSGQRPFFDEYDNAPQTFGLCTSIAGLMDFLSLQPDQNHYSEYVLDLLGFDQTADPTALPFRRLAWYTFFVQFLRQVGAAPEVKLYKGTAREIPVDLVLDMGNSRTCGVLFEEGDFTRAMMLGLRNLSEPHRLYTQPFDMRIAFRKADFGGAIRQPEGETTPLFQWNSFLRVGEEAHRLIYRACEEQGESETCNNYSSPKRYLWDTRPFDGRWQTLVSVNDPANVGIENNIYIKGLSEHFDAEGHYTDEEDQNGLSDHFSRSSLMTFVMIEILQHAACQINSHDFRKKHGNIDCRRYLRNIILTSPTAMPAQEQYTLRKAADDAWKVLCHINPTLQPVKVWPTPESLTATNDYDWEKRMWSYDEASCCQLVYLYAELAQRYDGEVQRFFDMKGHVRPDLLKEGYDKKSLTIGSVDIGAGTTDLMICAYEYGGKGSTHITPVPKFWDSFYLAGDDILRTLIQTFVIEGDPHPNPSLGCVRSALEARLTAMTDDELMALPCLKDHTLAAEDYRQKVREAIAAEPADRPHHLRVLASNMVLNFFDADSNLKTAHDRRTRRDFNTQISVPIAQKLLDLLRLHRPSRIYTFNDIFADVQPAHYLLDSFEHHFGFRFEELEWRFDPQHVADEVRRTLEPLMKQLSVVLHAYHCDILVLGGRPTSLDTITELFIKYYPLSPDRLIRLSDYRVGSWYPFADGQGYFFDQKSVVAVGAMVGFTASTKSFCGMAIDFKEVIKQMQPTANYLGKYNPKTQRVNDVLLTPEASTFMVDLMGEPFFIGCRQLCDAAYQARPLYAIYNNTLKPRLRLTLTRQFHEDRERLYLEEVTDEQGNMMKRDSVTVMLQSIADDGNYWLDKGEFTLGIGESLKD